VTVIFELKNKLENGVVCLLEDMEQNKQNMQAYCNSKYDLIAFVMTKDPCDDKSVWRSLEITAVMIDNVIFNYIML